MILPQPQDPSPFDDLGLLLLFCGSLSGLLYLLLEHWL